MFRILASRSGALSARIPDGQKSSLKKEIFVLARESENELLHSSDFLGDLRSGCPMLNEYGDTSKAKK